MNQTAQEPIRIKIDAAHAEALPNRIFGHNLEHTRGALTGGLSAQLLKNRKFAGKPSPAGVAADWEGLGDRAFYQTEGESYTRHAEGCSMPRRNELQRQSVQNIYGGECGIAQKGLFLEGGKAYELRVAAKSGAPVTLTAALTNTDGSTVYAARAFNLTPGDWQTHRATFTPPISDEHAALRLTFTARTEVIFGAVSLLPEDHFHGMRRDVVECLKQIAPTVLRWPGGNFAGEYRWKDGLLPPDERGPLESLMEDETQTYAHGYDFHEIGTDEFIALCREVGAEPFFTINPVWCAPEESRQWVEYCNGGGDTEYGRLRAQRGHIEPYGVKYWSLGNELGYGHMEGPMSPAQYADAAGRAAKAMLAKSPGLRLCGSGPYAMEDRAREWIDGSARALAPIAPYISFHTYSGLKYDYSADAGIRGSYCGAIAAADANIAHLRRLRAIAPPEILVSYDEWNVWAAWFRKSSAIEGMFVAEMLHAMLYASGELGAPIMCYFQPVGEGAIDISPEGASLAANGQVFALMKAHRGAELCEIGGLSGHEAAATLKGGVLALSLINDSFDAPERFEISPCGGVLSAECLIADDLLPGSHFTARALECEVSNGAVRAELPPRSIGLIKWRIEG